MFTHRPDPREAFAGAATFLRGRNGGLGIPGIRLMNKHNMVLKVLILGWLV